MDFQHVQYFQPSYEAAAPRGGLVMLPDRGNQQGGGTVSVAVRAPTLAQARDAALAQAQRDAAAQGLAGVPRIRAETYDGNDYSGILEFPRSAVASRPGLQALQDGMDSPPGDGDVPGTQVSPSPAPQRVKPSWVLVIPVDYQAPGNAQWGRTSGWGRAWIAPVRRSGIRMVSIQGDADDRDRLTSARLSDPDDPRTGQAVLGVARKYGAPAVAILRLDQGGAVHAWVWRGGGDPEVADSSGSPEGKEASISLLASILAPGVPSSAPDSRMATVESATTLVPDPLDVDVEETQAGTTAGSFGFSIAMETSDTTRVTRLRKAVSGLPGATVKAVKADQDGVEVTGSFMGDRLSFESALASVGVQVAH